MRTYSAAITRCVNQRSACARQAAGSRVPIVCAAATISSSVPQTAPTAGVRISGRAPRLVPSTGVPENSASIVGRPNGSSHWAGIQRQRARASSTALRFPPTSRDDQPFARALRRIHGPVITAVAVQFAQKEIPLLFATPKDVLGGIQSVVNERLAAVAFGVVA